jgi:hypothetical protein
MAAMNWEEGEVVKLDGMRSEVIDVAEMVCARHTIRAAF